MAGNAGSYVVPQVEIHQIFSQIPAALAQTQVAFVFGPNYQLHRFSDATEKAKIDFAHYSWEGDKDSSMVSGTYPGALDPEKVDKSYTKLFGDRVVVGLANLGTATPVVKSDEETKRDGGIVMLSLDELPQFDPEALKGSGSASSSDSSDPVKELKRDLRIGDYLRLTYQVGNEAKKVYMTNQVLDVVFVPEKGSSSSSSSSGSDSASDSSGVVIPTGKYLITLEDAIPYEPGLDGAAVPTVSEVILCEMQDGVQFTREKKNLPDVTTEYNWTDIETFDLSSDTADYIDPETELPGVKVGMDGQLYAQIVDDDFCEEGKSDWGLVYAADLYLEFRELLTAYSDTIHTLEAGENVMNSLGTVSPDNPLAQAVYNTAMNSGGQIVRYMAVRSDDLNGYSQVLEKATLTKEVYFFVPATRDDAVLDKVQEHVNAMSDAHVKRWRIAFVSAEIPENQARYTKEFNTDASEFYCRTLGELKGKRTIIQAVKREKTEQGTVIVVPNPDTKFRSDLVEGDLLNTNFRTEWGKEVCSTYKIVKIENNNTVIVDGAGIDFDEHTTGLGEKCKLEIYHPYTNAEKAEVIKNLSSSFADRRMYNVFPSVFSNAGVTQTGEFAAACVAGLVSSCLPQQPVTNLELKGIDDVPLVYQTFSITDLNTMASGGTLIVMQDMPNDQVYVRHQISTAYEKNNLNEAELSITKNLDSISFFLDNATSPYIGKYNITPELLGVIKNVITMALSSLEDTAYGLYGPQVISEGTEILLLEQDALLKDHVNCNVQLNLPYPFNHLVLKLFV